MTDRISDERLAELEALLLENAGLCAMRPDCNCTACATVRAFRELLALRELQERREREGSVMKPQSATPRTQKVYIADMEDTLTQLANIVGIPRDADLLIQRVRELAALKRDGYVRVPREPSYEWLHDMGIERDDWRRYLADFDAALQAKGET